MRKPAPAQVSSQAASVNAAVAALAIVLRFDLPADAVLSSFFREHKSGMRDRAFIAELTYAVLRRLRTLQGMAARCPAPPGTSMPRQMALLGLTRLQGWSLESAVRKSEHQWLIDVAELADDPAATTAEALDLPDWLATRLIDRHGLESVQALVQGLNVGAPLDLRVNLIKSDRETALAQLNAAGLEATACPFSPTGIRLKGKPALNTQALFLNGSVEVQDEGSQLLGLLVQARRGEMVVDFCAGAGGKTLQLGAMMRATGRLYAFDVADKRLAKLKPRLARAGLSNVHSVCIANENDQRVRRLAGKIDRVLVDAPCSGLGTLRRNPDLKWRQSEQSVAELTLKQTSILAAAARLLKVGGRLVYATCSILDEENNAIAAQFLAKNPGFVQLPVGEILAAQGIPLEMGTELCLRPDVHGTDGFYAAVFERRE